MCGVFAPQEMAQIHQLRMRFLGVVSNGLLTYCLRPSAPFRDLQTLLVRAASPATVPIAVGPDDR
jgi:hypothetical protein